jgi:hypothetical protein
MKFIGKPYAGKSLVRFEGGILPFSIIEAAAVFGVMPLMAGRFSGLRLFLGVFCGDDT